MPRRNMGAFILKTNELSMDLNTISLKMKDLRNIIVRILFYIFLIQTWMSMFLFQRIAFAHRQLPTGLSGGPSLPFKSRGHIEDTLLHLHARRNCRRYIHQVLCCSMYQCHYSAGKETVNIVGTRTKKPRRSIMGLFIQLFFRKIKSRSCRW